ncbi:uncharacterized [Tachysurus ichikawai]
MAEGGGKDRASREHTFSSRCCCRRSTTRPSQLIALSINEAWQVGTMRAAGPSLSRFCTKNNQVHESRHASLIHLKHATSPAGTPLPVPGDPPTRHAIGSLRLSNQNIPDPLSGKEVAEKRKRCVIFCLDVDDSMFRMRGERAEASCRGQRVKHC